eukprot:4249519-Prymnesium_polylepis.1
MDMDMDMGAARAGVWSFARGGAWRCAWRRVYGGACGVTRGGVAWRCVAWRGGAWRSVAVRGVAWRCVAARGVAWRRLASRGGAWRRVA